MRIEIEIDSSDGRVVDVRTRRHSETNDYYLELRAGVRGNAGYVSLSRAEALATAEALKAAAGDLDI